MELLLTYLFVCSLFEGKFQLVITLRLTRGREDDRHAADCLARSGQKKAAAISRHDSNMIPDPRTPGARGALFTVDLDLCRYSLVGAELIR